ncbi:MAG: efflux RND transporter periplasmic adaptor subunit [Planctomycetaceae bacterium]
MSGFKTLVPALLSAAICAGCGKSHLTHDTDEAGETAEAADESVDSEATKADEDEVKSSNQGMVFDADRRRENGIETTPVSRQRIAKTVRRIGWYIAPPASETVVRSPVAGFVVPQSQQPWLQPGQTVEALTTLGQINVFLTPQEISQLVLAKEDNDIQMQQALVTMELSEAQLKLATSARDAVTGVRIDQIREAYERSKAAYKEAQEKLPFLIQEPYDNGVVLKPIPVPASPAGRIIQLHVTPGQFVQAGDPLWTVGDWTTLWVRVPVFSGELHEAETAMAATVEIPEASMPVPVSRVDVPSPADPKTRTVDLIFSVANPDWKLRVGQSASVSLSLAEEADVLVVPSSALLYDSFGNVFCYAAESGSDIFERRRLELNGSAGSSGAGSSVIVVRGIDDDDIVISRGAEQLSAEESKSELAVEDDD